MDATEEAFHRAKSAYEQNCQQFRSLNQIMWQVPMIAVTLTGGLWYAVATLKGVDSGTRIGLLAFCAAGNILLILMINRVRDVMEAHLKKMEEFYPEGYATAPTRGLLRDRSVCLMFSLMMGLAAIVSGVGVALVHLGKWMISCP